MMYTVCNRHPLVEMCMLFVGTSIIHHSTEGIFILCNIWDLLIYSTKVNFINKTKTEKSCIQNILIFLFYCAAYSKLFLQTHKLRQCKNSLRYARKTCENLQMFWIQALRCFLLVDKYLLMYRLNDYGAHCFCCRRRCDDVPCSLHLYFHLDLIPFLNN